VLGFENNAWNIKMLRILQRLIDPLFKDLWTHLNLSILLLESGSFRLDLGRAVRFCSTWTSLNGLFAPSSTVSTCRAELKCSSLACASILTIHTFSHFLVTHGDIKETFEVERTLLPNGWKLETFTTVN
jgi:hypothetical protein